MINFLHRSPPSHWPTLSLLGSSHLLQQFPHSQCQPKFAHWQSQYSHSKLSSRKGLQCHPCSHHSIHPSCPIHPHCHTTKWTPFPQISSYSSLYLWQRNTVVFAARLASFPAINNVYSILGATPKWSPSPLTDPMEPVPVPTPTPLSTSMDDCPYPSWVVSPTITIFTGPSNSAPIVPSQCYMCQSIDHLHPNCSHYRCSSCGWTTLGYPNYKCPELWCSHCEQHGHFHVFYPHSMSPDHNPFMDTTWDLFHYEVNEGDRSFWDGTSRLWRE